MTGQLQVTQVVIGPSGPSDPPDLLCYASVVFCDCFKVSGIRLVMQASTGKARIHFPSTPQINSMGLAPRRKQARPTNPVTRSMIEWVVLRAYRDWLDTNAAQGRSEQTLVKEQAR